MTFVEIIGDILECHKPRLRISVLRTEKAN